MRSFTVKVENMQIAFAAYETLKLAKAAGVKLRNYKVDDDLNDVASKRCAIFAAVTRKKDSN